MHWQLGRGVLAPLEAPVPGSRWWRAVNARLLRDGCEAVAREDGLRGPPSSPTIALWSAFAAAPTASGWYRAHNASIVAAYLEHRELAESETPTERFFMNVVLLRVLFAHALVAAPQLALGRLAPVARPLGDPRLGMAGAFLSLSRILPDRYPVGGDVRSYVNAENDLGRLLDYGVILPRLEPLYEWSSEALGQPALQALVHDGSPSYPAPEGASELWHPAEVSSLVRLLKRATSTRPLRRA
jgi:hypothetical protein